MKKKFGKAKKKFFHGQTLTKKKKNRPSLLFQNVGVHPLILEQGLSRRPMSLMVIDQTVSKPVIILTLGHFVLAEKISLGENAMFFSYFYSCAPLGFPSEPKHLRKFAINQTTVSLSWKHPRHLGGRNDLFYQIECKIVCREDQLSCSQDCGSQVLFLPRQGNFTQTKATVTNLFSGTAYIFKIYAKNGVSAVAEKDGFSSKFAKLEVTTLESGMARSHRYYYFPSPSFFQFLFASSFNFLFFFFLKLVFSLKCSLFLSFSSNRIFIFYFPLLILPRVYVLT